MIDAERLKDEFLDLVCISSLSRREGAIARRLEVILKGMGATVEIDDAGERVGGETGNLLARFPGSAPGAPPFLLSCHMDTVGPAAAIRPVVDGDLVRTDGTSVLGGDDKAGIVAIFEAIRVLRGRGIPHGDIEVVLTICEESGLAGAKHFDTGRLRARRGLVLDVDGVSELITRAPGANRLAFTVHGLAAHAGICPEEGLSAIQMAAEAISAMRLGRLDAETTANLGVIEGGLATNIVPDRVVVRGETRSLSPAKLEAQTEPCAVASWTSPRGGRCAWAGASTGRGWKSTSTISTIAWRCRITPASSRWCRVPRRRWAAPAPRGRPAADPTPMSSPRVGSRSRISRAACGRSTR